MLPLSWPFWDSIQKCVSRWKGGGEYSRCYVMGNMAALECGDVQGKDGFLVSLNLVGSVRDGSCVGRSIWVFTSTLGWSPIGWVTIPVLLKKRINLYHYDIPKQKDI